MHEKLLEIMRLYDASAVGSAERIELGKKLEKEGSKLSERDYWNVVTKYMKGTH